MKIKAYVYPNSMSPTHLYFTSEIVPADAVKVDEFCYSEIDEPAIKERVKQHFEVVEANRVAMIKAEIARLREELNEMEQVA